MEPVFSTGYKYKKREGDKDVRPDRFHAATLMANRKDVWPSREQARKQIAQRGCHKPNAHQLTQIFGG